LSVSLSGTVRAAPALAASLEAAIEATVTAQATLVAAVAQQTARAADLQGAVRVLQTAAAGMSAQLAAPGVSLVTASLAAAVQATATATASIEAAVLLAQTRTSDLSAAVRDGFGATVSLSGMLQAAQALNAALQAAVQAAQGLTAAMNAQISAPGGVIVTADLTAAVQAGHSALAAIDAGKHIVMVNVEADVLAGPAMAKRARSAGLVEQYEAYQPLPGQPINGALTLGENIADLAGVIMAFRAWQLSLDGAESPVIDGFTGAERFFIGYGLSWRSQSRDEHLLKALLSDPHSPPRYRIVGVLKNVPEFYETYDLSEGDGMFLPAPERVSIW